MKKDNFDDVYKNIISEGLLDMFKKKEESSKKIQVAQTDKGSKEANWWDDKFSNVKSASLKIIEALKDYLDTEFGYGYWQSAKPWDGSEKGVFWRIEGRINEAGNKEIALYHGDEQKVNFEIRNEE